MSPAMQHDGRRQRSVFMETILSALVLVLIGNAAAEGDRCGLLPDIVVDNVKLRLYGRSVGDYSEFLLQSEADQLVNDTRFHADRPTVLYYHGFDAGPESSSTSTIIKAFLTLGEHNVVLVDWSALASGQYIGDPLVHSPQVGRAVALDQLHRSGRLFIHDLYLVGHSLGAQAAGYTGKHVTAAKIPRITGLDPAFPGFSAVGWTNSHLAATDAAFVDVVHTDSSVMGLPYSAGHVNFYPNGGERYQPGCSFAFPLSDEDYCSHSRAWEYFAESLNSTLPPFHGVACDSYRSFKAGRCTDNDRMVMGYHTTPGTQGSFFLETRESTPFSKGQAGLIAGHRYSLALLFKKIAQQLFIIGFRVAGWIMAWVRLVTNTMFC